MNNEIKVVTAATLVTAQMSLAQGSTEISVQDLSKVGINPNNVITQFQQRININLNPQETVKVSYENEGKDIRFETLDNYVLSIDINDTVAAFNKDYGPKSDAK